MAIYRLSISNVSRGKGGSATGAAAYRAGEKILDERTGLTHDYTQRKGVYSTEIITPVDAPQWATKRSELWNVVEAREKRKDARVAREYLVAIPHELGYSDRQNLVSTFCKNELVSRGMACDIGYHDFEGHNPHAHILVATRQLDNQGFGKKRRDWDKREFLRGTRQAWASHANIALERAGLPYRIDHRSLADQGIIQIPQVHLGRAVIELEKRGVRTELGDRYRAIEWANKALKALEQTTPSTRRDWTIRPDDERYLMLRQYALSDFREVANSLETLIAQQQAQLEHSRESSLQGEADQKSLLASIDNAQAALSYLESDTEVQAARDRQSEAIEKANRDNELER